jgi:hypothetical protein
VNPFEFVLALVIVLVVSRIVMHRMGIQPRSMRQMRGDPPVDDAETERLRSHVQQLQERIRVLERIVTDSGVQTAAQIEALRDRDRIAEEDKA